MTTPADTPLPGFLFRVDLRASASGATLCSGRFRSCSGLEATMEPKAIREGGRNWGDVQRVGHVGFATVVLSRGMTSSRDCWRWFSAVTAEGKHAIRLRASITLLDFAAEGDNAPHRDAVTWVLEDALPVKFKVGDLDAKAAEVAVEELHFVHQGLRLG